MAKRLRVLVVDAADTRGRIYGAQRVILDVAARCGDAVEWEIALPVDGGPYVDALDDLGCGVAPLPLRGSLPRAAQALAEVASDPCPHVIHSYDLRASAIARPVAQRLGVPLVTSYQEPVFYDHLRGMERLKRWWMAWLDRRTLWLTDRVIANSQAVADALVTGQGVPRERIVVLYNGVDAAALRAAADEASVAAVRAELGLARDSRVVLCTGSLTARKGQTVLLAAAPQVLARHPGTVLLFVGDGPDHAALEAQARSLGVDARFAGFREAVAPFYALADVVAVPSLGEAFGIVAAEAMALGKPVVASRVGGLAEVVADGVTGRLVQPGDAGPLAEALIGLLGDAAARRTLGEAGEARVAERFTLDRLAQGTLEVYRQVLEGRS